MLSAIPTEELPSLWGATRPVRGKTLSPAMSPSDLPWIYCRALSRVKARDARQVSLLITALSQEQQHGLCISLDLWFFTVKVHISHSLSDTQCVFLCQLYSGTMAGMYHHLCQHGNISMALKEPKYPPELGVGLTQNSTPLTTSRYYLQSNHAWSGGAWEGY